MEGAGAGQVHLGKEHLGQVVAARGDVGVGYAERLEEVRVGVSSRVNGVVKKMAVFSALDRRVGSQLGRGATFAREMPRTVSEMI